MWIYEPLTLMLTWDPSLLKGVSMYAIAMACLRIGLKVPLVTFPTSLSESLSWIVAPSFKEKG